MDEAMGGSKARGVQRADVFQAADALLKERQSPTIERIRLKIGRGSPNTVGPLLREWFATLGPRLEGARTSADEEASRLPLEVVQAAQALFDVASRHAAKSQAQATQATVRELELRAAAIDVREREATQREDAFEHARASLDAALASSQADRESLTRQLAEMSARAQEQMDAAARTRQALEVEVSRLTRLATDLQASKDALRAEHAASLSAQERTGREAEERHIERHAATERRLLAEVDRAREESKAAAALGAREKAARQQAEASLVLAREQHASEIRDARAASVQELAAMSRTIAELQEKLRGAQALHEQEALSHMETRALLKAAIPDPRRKASAKFAPANEAATKARR